MSVDMAALNVSFVSASRVDLIDDAAKAWPVLLLTD